MKLTHCAATETYSVVAAEIDTDEGEPDDARRVHGEADELGLVEVLGQVARLDGVERAHGDEEADEAERHDDAARRHVADESDAVLGQVEQLGVGRLEYEHHRDDGRFDADDDERDDELRRCAHEAWLARHDFLLTSGQDARNSIGLCHQRAVDETERQAGEDAGEVARDQRWLGYQRKCCQKADTNANQYDVAQFACRCLDYGRVVVTHEDHSRPAGCQDTQAGKHHSENSLAVAPLQVVDGDLVAAGERLVGSPALAARRALVLVRHVLVLLALGALPAALHALIVDLLEQETTAKL